MDKKRKEHSESKVSRAKKRVDCGLYDKLYLDILDLIISANTPRRKELLEVTGIYKEITKETKSRVKLSFYAAILSMLFGFLVLVLGLCLAWNKNLLAASVITPIGGTISAFITTTFLKIHQISLAQLNRFCRPVLKEILSVLEKNIDDLLDSHSREKARTSLIKSLLTILESSKLNFDA
jgi:hypothetical protein